MMRPGQRATSALVASLVVVGMTVFGCAGERGNTSARPKNVECSKADAPLVSAGRFTVAVDGPQIAPWFPGGDVASGRGFAPAVVYAIAGKLGFDRTDLVWTGRSTAGEKGARFDVRLGMAPLPSRPTGRTDTLPYYQGPQAIVVLRDSPFADARSVADFSSASLGASAGTRAIRAIEDLGTQDAPLAFIDTDEAITALAQRQVDGIVADLPTAVALTADTESGAVVVGRLDGDERFEAQFAFRTRTPELKRCVDTAIEQLEASGELRALERRWLGSLARVPVLAER